MPRLNPDRQIAHALQTIKVATRMLKEAEASIRSATKSPRPEKGMGMPLKPREVREGVARTIR